MAKYRNGQQLLRAGGSSMKAMKTYTITLTERDLKANWEFLRRTPLKGEEVSLFISLTNALKSAKTLEPKVKTPE